MIPGRRRSARRQVHLRGSGTPGAGKAVTVVKEKEPANMASGSGHYDHGRGASVYTAVKIRS